MTTTRAGPTDEAAGAKLSLLPFEDEPAEDSGTVVLHRLGPTEALAFGPAGALDLLGQTRGEVDRPFVDAMRTAIAVAPQLQGAVDGLTGRLVRLTAEAALLLRDNESMRTTVLTGVVRNPSWDPTSGGHTISRDPGQPAVTTFTVVARPHPPTAVRRVCRSVPLGVGATEVVAGLSSMTQSSIRGQRPQGW